MTQKYIKDENNINYNHLNLCILYLQYCQFLRFLKISLLHDVLLFKLKQHGIYYFTKMIANVSSISHNQNYKFSYKATCI